MKRILLLLAAAVLFVNTMVVPTVAHADGQPGGNCSGGAHVSRSRLTASYKKRTPLAVMLPTRSLHVIVSG